MHVGSSWINFVLQILKKDILIPETIDPDVVGYPPRILITARTNVDFTSPKIHIEGLDRECGFNLFMEISGKDTIKRSWCAKISFFSLLLASSLSDENATKSNMDFVQEPSAAAAESKSSLSSFALHSALEWYIQPGVDPGFEIGGA